MKRKNNAHLIILASCGACLGLFLIGFVICFVVLARNGGSSFFGGAMNMGMNMPQFLEDLKDSNYTAAESLVDPTAKSTLTAQKIERMEEQAVASLGPLTKIPAMYDRFTVNQVPGADGKMVVEYDCVYTLQYEKGDATAHIKSRVGTGSGASGLIEDFRLEPK